MIRRDLKPEIVEPPRITPEGIVLLWRPPGGEVRLVAAPTWLRVVAVVREALADLRYQVEADVWLAVLVAAMRDAMRPLRPCPGGSGSSPTPARALLRPASGS